jgi:hypothetical protein
MASFMRRCFSTLVRDQQPLAAWKGDFTSHTGSFGVRLNFLPLDIQYEKGRRCGLVVLLDMTWLIPDPRSSSVFSYREEPTLSNSSLSKHGKRCVERSAIKKITVKHLQPGDHVLQAISLISHNLERLEDRFRFPRRKIDCKDS